MKKSDLKTEIEVKLETNKKKGELKKLMQNIDEKQTGLIKADLFK